MYGSGFPKSLDVSKAIDRKRDDREDVLRVTGEIARLRDIAGLSNRDLDDAFGFAGMAGHWTSTKSQPTVPTVEQWAVLRDMLNPDEWLEAEVWRLNGRKGQPLRRGRSVRLLANAREPSGATACYGQHKGRATSRPPPPPQPNNGKDGAPHSSPRLSRSLWPASR
jgi:hypothetical protein